MRHASSAPSLGTLPPSRCTFHGRLERNVLSEQCVDQQHTPAVFHAADPDLPLENLSAIQYLRKRALKMLPGGTVATVG
jgi:hypothetical protein